MSWLKIHVWRQMVGKAGQVGVMLAFRKLNVYSR